MERHRQQSLHPQPYPHTPGSQDGSQSPSPVQPLFIQTPAGDGVLDCPTSPVRPAQSPVGMLRPLSPYRSTVDVGQGGMHVFVGQPVVEVRDQYQMPTGVNVMQVQVPMDQGLHALRVNNSTGQPHFSSGVTPLASGGLLPYSPGVQATVTQSPSDMQATYTMNQCSPGVQAMVTQLPSEMQATYTMNQCSPGVPSTVTPFSPGVPGTVTHFSASVPGKVTQFSPGWIQQMHHQLQQPQLSSPRQQHPQNLPHSVGGRAGYQSAVCQIRANAPEARFKALYPPGFQVFSRSIQVPGSTGVGNTPIRYPNVPIYLTPNSHMTGRFNVLRPVGATVGGHRSAGHTTMDIDQPCGPHSVQMVPHQAMDVDPSISTLALSSILDARLQLADMARTIRDILIQFVLSTYSGIMSDTYRVPRKPPVSHKHPDKALVRAREGESRVSMALECLSVVGQEAMLIVSDYHYENFLKNLNVKSVVPADRGHVTDLLTRFAASKMFGDFDMLVFHPKCGVFVIGLCSVNSNSDVQYILKRLQKARVQLDKSRSVAERAVRFLGLDCPVAAIFSTPNLKRSFLNKVTARDKSLHRSLGTLNVIALDELPLQFRSQWSSQQHFDLLTQWWTKVKADQMVKCQLSAEQFSILVGSFLCPIVSSVDFEQGQQAPPSDCHMPSFENQSGKETGAGKQAISTITTVTTDLSSLSLSIGNVTKSFTQYMDEYVDFYFPNFTQHTYRVPPVHFNIQKVSSCGYAGYDILDMPMSKDTRGDEGENRVVSAIEILGLKYEAVKPVFIICDFQYNNYLNKLKETMFIKGDDRRPQRAYGQSVRAQHDCLLVHRNYGIVIISVKAVGDNFDEWATSGTEQWTAVRRTLGKVLKQLPREEKMVQLVLSDLTSELRFHKLVALPNLFRHDVDTAISNDPDLQQQIEAMFPGKGTLAFLCKDELCENHESIWEVLETRPDTFSRLCHWWDIAMGPGQPGVLSEALAKQIIGRYCGLLSTVEVWSVQTPRVEVRSLAEAIQETAERFSQILLTQEQVAILHSPARLLFLTGAPGGGKTLTLMLKAETWARNREHVVILNLRHGSLGLPLGHLLHKQLQMTLMSDHTEKGGGGTQCWSGTSGSTESLSTPPPDTSPAHSPAPSNTIASSPSPTPATVEPIFIQRIDLDSSQFDCDNPGQLAAIPLEACVVVDEITRASHPVLEWLIKFRHPKYMWCAGQFQDYCPDKFEMQRLQRVLRCPPMIQRVVQHTSQDLGLTAYNPPPDTRDIGEHSGSYILTSAPHGLATDGSRPWIIFHSKHDRPSQLPLDCEQCAHDLADIFIHRLSLQPVVSSEQTKRRRLGPPPVTVDTLLWKDVVMVCRHADSCILTSTMKKRGVPMTIISATADPQVALPTRDELIYTTPFAMTGLERKVVVYIPFQSLDPLTSHMQDEVGRGDGVEGEGRGGDLGLLGDLQLGQALQQLSGEDRVSLWYTASRCLAQLVIFIP